MTLKNRITTLLFCTSAALFAQENKAPQDTVVKKEIKLSYLDSIKATFVHDEMASCIDSMWMKELTALDIYDTMLEDIKNVNVDQPVDYELPTEVLKERLKRLDEKSPFNIEYNPGLENVIKSFLKNRKRHFERLMGIAQFYFPIFEEEMAKNNIPLEIKYLAVVESALNPLAVSRVGATGLWQFMYQTGKQYNLDITTYVDERSDLIKSSQAASQYMKNMYQIFGDWDLVLASYNSGPGNVAKAIRRSGGQQNYWNIRKNLPKETQGYVPAFLATMYIFEYHKEHGIVPNKAIANHFATDTIHIKNHITFKQLSDLLDIPVNEIQFYNPSFKRKEVPAITGERHYIRLPKDKVALFTSNEEKIYAYVKHEESLRERPFERINSRTKDTSAIAALNRDYITRTRYHKVRRGDNLTEIAEKYDVTVTDIKRWNHLRSDRAPLGRRLKIKMPEEIVVKTSKKEVAKDSTNKAIAAAPSSNEVKYEIQYKTEKVVVNKDVVKYHKVKSGDVLGEIAGKYDVTVAELRKWNKIKGNNIGIGDNIKIIKNEKVVTTVRKEIKVPVTEKMEAIAANDKAAKVERIKNTGIQDSTRSVNYYVVTKGDNLGSIAKKHNVSVEQLRAWNNIMGNNVKLGTQLIISDDAVAVVREEEVAPKKEFRTEEYTVGRGDNLGSIAKKYNTSVDQLKEWNNRTDNSIQVGEKLVVNKTEVAVAAKTKEAVAKTKTKETLYHVRKGDSLFSISKKFPGVSIADIKRWNNIKGESITPGMKLKING